MNTTHHLEEVIGQIAAPAEVYLAQAKAALKAGPPLFAPGFETLITLHDKWLFIEKARELRLSAPSTTRIASRDELLKAFAEREPSRTVFKPVYSRFAAQTIVRPRGIEALDGMDLSTRVMWVTGELSARSMATTRLAEAWNLV